MFGSDVLDIAIGMAFIFLLLSLIASTVQEIFASFLQARSANLHRAIRSLFSEDSLDENPLVEAIYDHGLIRGLYLDAGRNPGTDPAHPGRSDAPDDVRTRLSKLRGWLQRKLGIAPDVKMKLVSDPMQLPSYIPSRTFALAMMDLLHQEFTASVHNPDIAAFLNAKAVENKAYEAMRSLYLNAGADLQRFQSNLEGWYNDAMDRASGWYKKNTQNTLLLLGLILAAAMNVDSIQVAETLTTSRDARQAMVDAAKSYGLQAAPAGTAPAAGTAAAGTSASEPPDKLAAQLSQRIAAFQTASSALLPVGWTPGQRPPEHWWNPATWSWKLVESAGERSAGWVITAIAISLGAPFWFDTLNRFMVVRSTIKPQEKSPIEGSKD